MGQGSSKPNGSLVLGCLAGQSSPCADQHAADTAPTDITTLHVHPAWYSLLSNEPIDNDHRTEFLQPHTPPPLSDATRLGHSDQTHDPYDHIATDIAYVDRMHYANINHHPQDTKCTIKGEKKHVTWADVSAEFTVNELWLSSRNLESLSANIGLAVTLQKLDLSNNHLTTLPDAIGHLRHLQVLNLAHNHLTVLPDTLAYLTRLVDLDVSDNRLSQLTPYIGHLSRLRKLHVGANQLAYLPIEVVGLTHLATLHVSDNPSLCALPAELLRLSNLQHIYHDRCPLLTDTERAQSLRHNPPSLKERCARAIIDRGLPLPSYFPSHLRNYLTTAKPCSACNQTYLDTHVSRLRVVDKAETMFLVEYRLCSAHWSDEDDRVLYEFSHPTNPCVSPSLTRDLPPLPQLDANPKETSHQRLASLSGLSCSSSITSSIPTPFQEDETSSQKLPAGWRPQRMKKVASRTQSSLFGFTSKLKRPNYGLFSPFASSNTTQSQ